ncbi:hypothetical protein AZL_011640 [Azospirillum sp. B510]|uniref:ATP-binding protein n=1 Tax=Azospirillum sp. (strain B510) TaxID=137722 RepID=UPI0001C4C041|nr:ATP-binding protein [Azospirillum sp. B510]BAI71802.1 hypothetical protein AZL_011640 [Azospirillum sp. B510]
MSSPVECSAAHTVGTVSAVSTRELHVILDFDAPQATALNTGVPTGFPRINSYVLMPIEGGAVVGAVSRIAIGRYPSPKPSLRGDELVNLPIPVRTIELTPVGTLCMDGDDGNGRPQFRMVRGVPVLPSVGDPVLLPSRDQTRSIIEGHGDDRRVQIGNAPFGLDAPVTIDPDKLFGRHLAILGNTGSGKSCSVAGVIRWSLEAAAEKRSDSKRPNARFIVLDPNGEYGKAFSTDGLTCRTFAVGGHGADHALAVPGWLWNSQEWAAFTAAQPGSQRPLLMKALRALRNSTSSLENVKALMQRRYRGYLRQYEQIFSNIPSSISGFPANKNFGESVGGLKLATDSDMRKLPSSSLFEHNLIRKLGALGNTAEAVRLSRQWQSGNGYNDFIQTDVERIIKGLQDLLDEFPPESQIEEKSEDTPSEFDVSALPSTIEEVAMAVGGGAMTNVEPLVNRIQVMLGDSRLRPIIVPDGEPSLAEWLDAFVGEDAAVNGEVAVLDLSLVPSDVVHVTVAVIARLVFEAVQRYKKARGEPLPTTLVLEEAHTYLRKEGDLGASAPAADVCRQIFERIAREGRKFGLGLLLSSQRPSELSPTVLAQCNTFLLHRIVNDLDQALVRKLVPDALGSLLGELPTLPSQQAILLGWAAPLPVLVRMRDLPREQRPRSDDPDFWAVWTGERPRPIDWETLAEEWQAAGTLEDAGEVA